MKSRWPLCSLRSTRVSLALFFLLSALAVAHEPGIQIKGFLDVYYGHHFRAGASQRRPSFLYNHTTTDEPAVNLALLQADVMGGWYRASVGIMAGTYAEENLATEPELLQHLWEGYVGLALDQDRTIWLDLGVFTSHIGFESAISADNPTLGRSLMAENSPYYLTGGRLTWKPNDEWEFAALVVNGWQRMEPLEGNRLPSFGTKVAWKPHDRLSLNWSTYVGSELADEERRMRYFNNFFAQWTISPSLTLFSGVDIGWQENELRGYDTWWSPNMILRWEMNHHWTAAFRVEKYLDPHEVIVALPGGTELTGASAHLDRRISEHVLLRWELRYLHNDTPAFYDNGSLVRNDTSFLTSITIRF